MSSFALDPATGDFAIVNGRLRRIDGAEEKAQKIANRLRLFLGEWFLDTRIGVPWYRVVLVKSPNLELIKTLFQGVILSVPGIVRVENVTVDFDRSTRELSYSFECYDDAGTRITGGSGEPFIVDIPGAT